MAGLLAKFLHKVEVFGFDRAQTFAQPAILSVRCFRCFEELMAPCLPDFREQSMLTGISKLAQGSSIQQLWNQSLVPVMPVYGKCGG